jgi:hypothetical protein
MAAAVSTGETRIDPDCRVESSSDGVAGRRPVLAVAFPAPYSDVLW